MFWEAELRRIKELAEAQGLRRTHPGSIMLPAETGALKAKEAATARHFPERLLAKVQRQVATAASPSHASGFEPAPG
jgi:hypothetical protein